MIPGLCAFIALLVLAVCAIVFGNAQAASPSLVPWTSLRLQAEKLAGRITAEVRIETQPAEPLPPGLWPPVKGETLHPLGPSVLKLSIRGAIDPVGVAPLNFENQLWFDPESGAPLRLIRTRLGADDYMQWFVFGREQVFRRQHEPANRAQTAASPESWKRVSQNAYTFRTERCPIASETSMVIYHLSDAIAKGDLDLAPRCVFHKRQLHLLTFRTEPLDKVAYNYLELNDRGRQRRRGEMGAVKIWIKSTPVGSYRGSVEPWFKDAYLTISRNGRLPLVVACDMPVVGHVELNLDEIRFD